jgi:hypothetical protein
MTHNIWLPRIWLSLAVAITCASCGDDQDPAGARALWNELHAQDYRSWQRAPGYESRRGSDAPHGGAVDIYLNEVAAEALGADPPVTQWPEGAIVVKDGWDGDDLDQVAVMQRRADGWYWAEYDADGDSVYSGKPDACIQCHKSGADFVRAFPFPTRK